MPNTKNTKKPHGLVTSHRSTSSPSHTPSPTASTNEKPTVLRAPSCRTVSDSGCLGLVICLWLINHRRGAAEAAPAAAVGVRRVVATLVITVTYCLVRLDA